MLGVSFFELFGGVFPGVSDEGIAVLKEVVAGKRISARVLGKYDACQDDLALTGDGGEVLHEVFEAGIGWADGPAASV